MTTLLDKNNRQIMPGDVVKVFHFIGARNKKHYMYKIIHELDGHLYGAHAHNVHKDGISLGNSYALPRESCRLDDYEIVEGYGAGPYDTRPKLDIEEIEE